MQKKWLKRWAFLAAFSLLTSGCGITAEQIHKWGHKGQYDRIRAALSEQPDENVRIAAAAELGKGDYAFGIPDLIKLSKDASSKVRAAAVTALGQYAGAEVYNTIIQRTGDDNIEVARSAEQILRTWSEETVPYLVEAVSDRNYKVRVAAVTILGRMKDPQVPKVLQDKAQRDDNNVVRREAVRAIGNLGLTSARQLLYKIKPTDTSQEVVLVAAEALAKIPGNITDISLLLLPFQTPADLRNIAVSLDTTIAAQITSNKLCQLMQGPETITSNLQSHMLDTAKNMNVDQVVSGTISQKSGKITIDLLRLDAKTGATIQRESYTGLKTQSTEVVRELTRRFIAKFI